MKEMKKKEPSIIKGSQRSNIDGRDEKSFFVHHLPIFQLSFNQFESDRQSNVNRLNGENGLFNLRMIVDIKNLNRMKIELI